jgi:hypothetical protein
MKFNIIRPGTDHHSAMFLEIAELLSFSIQELGSESIVSVAEAKFSYKNIVISVFYEEDLWTNLPEGSIIINTEPLFARGDKVGWSERLIELSSNYAIWDYDPRNLQILTERGAKNSQLLKFGYQKELERIPCYPDSDRPIDVLFYGSMNNRRKDIFDQITSMGLVFKPIFGVYGHERDEFIARSKMVINVHFNELNVFEIIRVHYLLNNAVAVVPEISPSTSIEASYLNCLVGVPYFELVQRCISLKENPDDLLDLRLKALNEFKNTPQTTYMLDLLDSI